MYVLAFQVTLEVLSYHATAPLEDAVKLSKKKIPSAAAMQLQSFTFDDFGLSNDETLEVGMQTDRSIDRFLYLARQTD